MKYFYGTFYGLLFMVGFYGVKSTIQGTFLKHFEDQIGSTLLSAFIELSLFSSLILLIVPIFRNERRYKVMAAIAVNWIYFNLFYLKGEYFYSCHPWLISSIFMASIGFTNKENQKVMLRILQTLLLSHYFFTGLWKLRSLRFDNLFKMLYEGTLEHFAYILGDKNYGLPFLTEFLIEKAPLFLVMGFAIIILFQLSSVVAIFWHPYRRSFIWGIFLFHAVVLLVTGIPFLFTPVALYLMVIVADDVFDIRSHGREYVRIN